jgi:hypothetical protein
MRTSLLGTRVSHILALAALLAALAVASGDARAQVCGDADGDGAITDADAVDALRAGASLSSMCTRPVCDVNADGVVNDTDGVILLRTAADLPATATCLSSGGVADQRAVLLVEFTEAFLTHAFALVPQTGFSPIPGTIPCDNFFDDGTIEIDFDSGDTSIFYDNCELDGMILDGEVDNTVDDGLTVDVAILSTFSDDELDFLADNFQVVQTGSSLRISGTVEVTPSFATSILEDAFDFTMRLTSFEVAAGTGTLLGGTANLDLTDAEITGLRAINTAYNGSNIAQVTIIKDDATMTPALFNLDTGSFL